MPRTRSSRQRHFFTANARSREQFDMQFWQRSAFPCQSISKTAPPLLFCGSQRLSHELLQFRPVEFVWGVVFRPVPPICPHRIQSLLNFGIAARELIHQVAPACRKRLRFSTRRIFACLHACIHVRVELLPLFRYFCLQLRRPKISTLRNFCPSLRAEILSFPFLAPFHLNLPHNELKQFPVRLPAGLNRILRVADCPNRLVELPPLLSQHLLLPL